MLHHCYQGIELGEMYDEGFIIWLWEAFNSCVDFQAFVEAIKKNGLYDPMYETILNEYYSRYQKNEKDIDKKWVCEIIEKLINVKPKYRLTNDKKQENHDNKVSEIP